MASKTTLAPINIIVFGLGALAVYSAIKDVNPLDLVKNTLQGKPAPEGGSWSPDSAQSVVFTGPQTITQLGTGSSSLPQGKFSGKMIWPTTSHRISQEYGVKNDRYESGYHTGLDIDGACGDPIWAPAAGTIKRAGFNGPYGLQVQIAVGGNTEVWLNHFSGIGAKIRPGLQVSPGDHIGSMGSTGNSTGCHLHFEVRVNGQPVNPHSYLGGSGVVNA